MEILFESYSEQEEEFEYEGEIIVNKGHVQIIRLEKSVTDEADTV